MPCLYLSSIAIFYLIGTIDGIFLEQLSRCCDFKKISPCVKNLNESSISFSRCASCPPDSIRCGANFLGKTKECENNKKGTRDCTPLNGISL